MNYSPSKKDLYSQLNKIKENSAIGRSLNLIKLLEYLLIKEAEKISIDSNNVQTPKEMEIAIDVFGKDVQFNSSEDSSVRVHISRLRKKLAQYYLSVGKDEAFYISIPVGEYRLVFISNTKVITNNKDEITHQNLSNTARVSAWGMNINVVLVVCSFTLLVHVALLVLQLSKTDNKTENIISTNTIWQDFQHPNLKNIIVLGTKPSNDSNESGLRISTRASDYLISKNLTLALKNILSISNDFRYTQVVYASELSVKDIKQANIIYLGHYQYMGILESYFNASKFDYEADNSVLKNKESRIEYLPPLSTQEQYIDYGLFAKIDGPRNNKIYIISGYTDSSLLWLSWFLTSANYPTDINIGNSVADLDINNGENYELLFKIPSMNGEDVGHEVISGSAIISKAIWNNL